MLSNFDWISDGHLGKINFAKHQIEFLLAEEMPNFSTPYCAGSKARELEKNGIDKILSERVVEPAHTEWAAPSVFTPKKNRSLRFSVDYWKLNAVKNLDIYPIERMDECIGWIGEAAVFPTLDRNSGYWDVEIENEDWDKTAYASIHGLYRFVRMPIVSRNALSSFQRTMNVAL